MKGTCSIAEAIKEISILYKEIYILSINEGSYFKSCLTRAAIAVDGSRMTARSAARVAISSLIQ